MTPYHDDILSVYARSFRDNWELPALSEFGAKETMTYADMARRIARIHMLYSQIGLQQGDKVALVGKNSPTWVLVFMATITYGATIVPVLQDFTPHDAQHIINHSDATLLFIDENLWEGYDFAQLPAIRAVISLKSRHVLAERSAEGEPTVERLIRNLTRRFNARYRNTFAPADVEYPAMSPQDVAIINYTSGTTGFSKGVMLTYGNICGNVMFGIDSRLHFRGSRNVAFLPLAHAYGCAFDMLVPLAVGSHITIFSKPPIPQLLLKAMADRKSVV